GNSLASFVACVQSLAEALENGRSGLTASRRFRQCAPAPTNTTKRPPTMLRKINTVLILTLLTLPMTIGGCEKKNKGETENPDNAEGGDPVEELKAIPDRIQAEIDGVIKPIDDAEKLMADIETIPERY